MWLTRLLLLKELSSANSGVCSKRDNARTPAADVSACFSAPSELGSTDSLFLSTRKICRLCSAPAHTPLLDKPEGFDVVSAVRVVTNISIAKDDCYPKYVCACCLGKLKASLMFKRKCEHTNMMFRQMAQPEYRPSDPVNFQRHDFTLFLQQMIQRRAQRTQLKLQRKRKLKKRSRKLVNQFKCIYCDIPFYSREALEAHRAQRACARRPCPRCRVLVLNVPLHVRRVHRTAAPAAVCAACGHRARTPAALRAHMSLHSERYDYPCELCPYRGKRRAYLALHMRTHTGERPYLCARCPLTFTNASNFRKHALVHRGKPFQCPKCNKLFRSAKSLREHDEGYHLKILHPCATCGKTFTYRSLLLRHERKVHHRARASPGAAPQAAPAGQDGAADGAGEDACCDVPMGTYLQFKNTSHHSQDTVVNEQVTNPALIIFQSN